MKAVIATLVLALLASLACIASGRDDRSDRSSIWMRQKLRASQEVLKGLPMATSKASAPTPSP